MSAGRKVVLEIYILNLRPGSLSHKLSGHLQKKYETPYLHTSFREAFGGGKSIELARLSTRLKYTKIAYLPRTKTVWQYYVCTRRNDD